MKKPSLMLKQFVDNVCSDGVFEYIVTKTTTVQNELYHKRVCARLQYARRFGSIAPWSLNGGSQGTMDWQAGRKRVAASGWI